MAWAGGTAGRRSVKVAPSPGTLSTVRSPPIARARSRLMASPSPDPSLVRVSPVESCTNGWKIASCALAGMPGPVSRTCRHACAPSTPACTRTVPPAGVNLSALDSRLSTICSTRSRSAQATAPSSAAS